MLLLNGKHCAIFETLLHWRCLDFGQGFPFVTEEGTLKAKNSKAFSVHTLFVSNATTAEEKLVSNFFMFLSSALDAPHQPSSTALALVTDFIREVILMCKARQEPEIQFGKEISTDCRFLTTMNDKASNQSDQTADLQAWWTFLGFYFAKQIDCTQSHQQIVKDGELFAFWQKLLMVLNQKRSFWGRASGLRKISKKHGTTEIDKNTARS